MNALTVQFEVTKCSNWLMNENLHDKFLTMSVFVFLDFTNFMESLHAILIRLSKSIINGKILGKKF